MAHAGPCEFLPVPPANTRTTVQPSQKFLKHSRTIGTRETWTHFWRATGILRISHFLGAAGLLADGTVCSRATRRIIPIAPRWANSIFPASSFAFSATTPPWCSGIGIWRARRVMLVEFSLWYGSVFRKAGGSFTITPALSRKRSSVQAEQAVRDTKQRPDSSNKGTVPAGA